MMTFYIKHYLSIHLFYLDISIQILQEKCPAQRDRVPGVRVVRAVPEPDAGECLSPSVGVLQHQRVSGRTDGDGGQAGNGEYSSVLVWSQNGKIRFFHLIQFFIQYFLELTDLK